MSPVVQVFSCPKCNRGEFRSLPGPDGKAYCPWCGDKVGADGAAAPAAAPAAGTAAAVAPPTPDLAPQDAPVVAVNALRGRIAELERRCEQAESELRKEQEKKQEIKKAVMTEMAQLTGELHETKILLPRLEGEHRAAVSEMNRLKDELAQEKKRFEELAASHGTLEEKDKLIRGLESELEGVKKSLRDRDAELEAARKNLQSAQNESAAFRRDAEDSRKHFDKQKESIEAEKVELLKTIKDHESRIKVLRIAADEVKGLKARTEENKQRSEKERAELQQKIAALQADVAQRDQRVRELQMLVKTLGERLNDLTSRRF